jgi:hypothetical protein
LQVIRVKPEKEKTEVGGDDGPAGAGCLFAGLAAANPDAVKKSPPDERRHNFAEEEEGHQGENRVEHAVKQVRSNPPDNADTGHRRLYVVGVYGFGKWFHLFLFSSMSRAP